LGQIPNWRAMSNNSIVAPENIDDIPNEFWNTYNQGEPFGLINLELSRLIGRTGETQYPDPDVEGFNPCQPGFATLLTKDGVKLFDEINIGDDIWSKEGWTKVLNKWSTGIKPVYNHYTTGGVFVGTENHKVDTPDGKVEIKDAESILTIGGCPQIKCGFDYQIIMDGLFLGDGYHKKMKGRNYTYPCLVIGSDDQDYFTSEILHLIKNRFGKGNNREDFNIETTITTEEKLRAYDIVIPERYYLKDVKTTLSLLRGLYSADGSVINQNGNSCRITYKTASKKLSRQVQQMLSSVGIRSYITTNNEKIVQFKNGKYKSKESYDVNITKDFMIFNNLIGFIQKYKNDKIIESSINYKGNKSNTYTSKNETEFLGEFEVFDITVDNNSHTYWTGGISVSNCAEQGLNNYETCCLSEVFLPNITSYDELLEVLMYTYRMNKHSLSLPCSLKETEAIVNKNMRMGVGMTGILQASEEQRSWLKDAYLWLRDFDVHYSLAHGFPRSIKLTTVKPSGTLSLLAGVTPGVHPNPAGPYYIRRVRISLQSPLVDVCRKNGYPIEYNKKFDGSDDKSTMVISFPCKVPETTPVAADYGWRDQMDMIRRIQREWSDNSVSCTVYYKKEDLDEIKQYLKEHFRNEIKSISFLLYHGHGFVQAPYETITKEVYMEMVSKTNPITSVEVNEDDMAMQDCDSGACPIK